MERSTNQGDIRGLEAQGEATGRGGDMGLEGRSAARDSSQHQAGGGEA